MTWAAWLLSMAGPFALRMLFGVGAAVLTIEGIGLAVNTALGWVSDALSGVPVDAANVLGLAGVWQGLGYVGGAYMARVTIANAEKVKRLVFG